MMALTFLGFTSRHKSPHSKYHTLVQLLITPQKEKVIQFLQRCSKLISEYRGNNLQQLLMALNPKLKGFANYYRFVVSKHTYHRITGEIWQYTDGYASHTPRSQ